MIILHGGGLAFEAGQGIGILLCLAAAFSYGLSALLARRLPGKLAAAGNSDISAAGLGRNDDDRCRRG